MVPYERSDTIGFLNVLYTFLCTMISCVRKSKVFDFGKKSRTDISDMSIYRFAKTIKLSLYLYIFSSEFQCAWVTRISLLYANVIRTIFYTKLDFIFIRCWRKKKERRADNAIYKKEKKNPYMCKKRRKDNDERLKLELSFNQWDTGNRSIMVSLKGQLNFLSLFIRNKSWNKRFVIPIVHITMNGP